jgi:dienelactone hydrolase
MDGSPIPLLATVTALAMKAAAQDLVTEDLSFESGGKTIGVAAFKLHSAQRLPAIIVLHGAGGIDSSNAYVRQIASVVAANGYATYLVEYFDRTATSYADDRTIHANAEMWLATLGDAVTFVSGQPGVAPARIGMFGYSLGGYLAVAHSARDPRVRAIVELAGGIEPDLAGQVRRLPPTLIIHGKEDRRVPFARAAELQSVLTRLGAHVETQYFPGESHILSPMAAFQAISRALQFFEAQLRGSATRPAAATGPRGRGAAPPRRDRS